MKNTKQKGFTLVELLVVITIIGLLSTLVVAELQQAQRNSRDTQRLVEMDQMKKAVKMFFNEHARYPDNDHDGISTSGEIIGDGAGAFETAIQPYLPIIPIDPKYEAGFTGNDNFYYAYDPTHSGCEPVISINRFESQGIFVKFGHQDTSAGGDMNIDTAHYNYCFK